MKSLKHVAFAAIGIVGVMFAAAPASAQTYTEKLDLPGYGAGGPRVLQRSGSFTTGTVLSAANQTSNPSGWGNAFNVLLDTTAQTITFTGDGSNTYQTIDFDLTGISGFAFTGLNALTPYGATATGQGTYGYNTSFTGTSLHIGYASTSLANGNYFQINQGSSVFKYSTAAATPGVPEPATWAMMLIGFGGLGVAMRRRKSVGVRVRFA
jgi:hypothetical protein